MGSTPRRTDARDEIAAPTAFVSYAHGDEPWNATVLDFATALRKVVGIDADIDQWRLIGGQDWTTYGANAIQDREFILIVASEAYKAVWEGRNRPDRNAGAAREAAVVKAIFDRDQDEFRRRVRVVLLGDYDEDVVPDDLRVLVDRFPIATYDPHGLGDLRRSLLQERMHELPDLNPLPAQLDQLRSTLHERMHELPPDHSTLPAQLELLSSQLQELMHQLPDLSPLPALPAGVVDEIDGRSLHEGHAPEAASRTIARAEGDDRRLVAALGTRLATIDRTIAAGASDETVDADAGGPDVGLRERRSAVKASLAAVERSLTPIGARRQAMVGDYLNAQLYVSAGAFQAADERLEAVLRALPAQEAYPAGAVFEPCLSTLATFMVRLNEKMRDDRHAAGLQDRHPEPPAMELGRARTSAILDFYEVARAAMDDASAEGSLGIVRRSILRGRTPSDEHARRLYLRYTRQQEIACPPLGLERRIGRGSAGAANWLAHTDLHDPANSIAADVLGALAQAHRDIHLVERRRSGPVGATLDRGKAAIRTDRIHLRRSIVLNTFAHTISETMPWIFAADEAERTDVQRDPAAARRELRPHPTMWHARQVTLLALYRRSHGFRSLGDNERAYNDLRMLQRIGRLTRLACKADGMLTGWVDTLEALAEYRIGELYRADHDYMQALVHLCRSHDSVQALDRRQDSAIAREIAHLQVKLSLGKGKAFFEIGAMKRSLKWHLTAWRWLLRLERVAPELEAEIANVEDELDRVKHDPILYKADVEGWVAPVIARIVCCDLAGGHRALEADILVRIGHLLTVLRLPEDDAGMVVDSSALTCMKRAAVLDEHNLLVQTGLLHYEMRRHRPITDWTMPDPMSCWPSGASDVDQVIRLAEHLMLERLHAAGGSAGMGEQEVARALMEHFMTHTDSINLRGAILHRYLMRRRAEDRENWWEDPVENGDAKPSLPPSTVNPAPYLEFVCLRRFGSFTPFMPRPAAVSAVGGGYLVRVPRSPEHERGDCPAMFNIVVDPGEGAVNNLYAMGLSIADIDMVVATHDHPEHLAALDAILSLRRELKKRRRVAPTDPARSSEPEEHPRLLILGNRSVVNRYSFLNGDQHHLVQHIADSSVLGGLAIPDGVTIVALPTKHEDLGGDNASGFMLTYSPDGGSDADRALQIAFMADTDIMGIHEERDPENGIDGRWQDALESDVVIAHVGDVPSGELRKLAKLPPPDDASAIGTFDRRFGKLAAERPADASQLMHALSLLPPDPDVSQEPVSLLSEQGFDTGEHLYLDGLLEVCTRMSEAPPRPGGGGRILIVGELKEQLGSFRGTIAREINSRILGLDDDRHGTSSPPLIALTADIGLRIRITSHKAGSDVTDRNTVLCSTCSYNNDRLDMERFHPPQDIYEVCVKGDHEAMYWNCHVHDPGRRVRAMFVEQLGGYNPFAAGGRYHG